MVCSKRLIVTVGLVSLLVVMSLLSMANNQVTTLTISTMNEDVALSADGSEAYVVGATNADKSFFYIVETANKMKIKKEIALGSLDLPKAIAVTDQKAYTANFLGGSVYIIDLEKGEPVDLDKETEELDGIKVGEKPMDIIISQDATKAVVANSGNDTLSVIDVSENKVTATIEVGDSPRALAKVASTSETTNTLLGLTDLVYVANYYDDTISVVDLSKNEVTATIDVGEGPTGLAVSSDGTYAYVANALGDAVSVVNIPYKQVLKTVTIGSYQKPSSLAMMLSNDKVFVANFLTIPKGTVSVIDTESHEIVETIEVGKNPNAVAISPNGNFLYVLNSMDQTLSKINIGA